MATIDHPDFGQGGEEDVVEWLKARMAHALYMEYAMTWHEGFWGVPYGPTLTMTPGGWNPTGIFKDLRELQLQDWPDEKDPIWPLVNPHIGREILPSWVTGEVSEIKGQKPTFVIWDEIYNRSPTEGEEDGPDPSTGSQEG